MRKVSMTEIPTMTMTQIAWTRPLLDLFEDAYGVALDQGKGEFTFEGNVFLCGYAKYLIEYLDAKLID